MPTSKPPSQMPLTKINSKLAILIALLSLAGFLDAAYLSIEHYHNVIPNCTIVHGCGTVLTSVYSTIGTIPVALLGSFYYLTVLIIALLYLDIKKEQFSKLIKLFTWFGLIASAYFVALQIFVLHNICLYCMGSAFTSTALFICGRFFTFAPHEVPADALDSPGPRD